MMHKFRDGFVLKLCVFFIFFGRAYQFIFFGAPFRAVFWDESLMSPIVEKIFNTSWNEYSTNLTINYYIEVITVTCGIIFLFIALVALFWDKIESLSLKNRFLKLGIFLLVVLTFLIFKSKNFRVLEIFEMFIQLSLPTALLFSNKLDQENISLYLRFAIGVTFIAHGLYALGIPFQPGHFIDMTINITGLNEDSARVFLKVAGVLDIIAAILLFHVKTINVALSYILVWGLLTACARIIYGFNSLFILDTIHNSLYQTLYRLPHGLIAIALYKMQTNKENLKLNYNEA